MGSIYLSSKPKHSIQAELDYVHNVIMSYQDLKQQAATDVAKAKVLERYLRKFKIARRQVEASPEGIQKDLENIAINDIETIITSTNTSLGFSGASGALFRRVHGDFLGAKSRGGDDIFEAEFSTFLNQILQTAAIDNNAINLDTQGASMVGNIPGNISKSLLEKISDNKEQIKHLVMKKSSQFLNEPMARAIKTDVSGYLNINIETNIKPEWQEFIAAVAGANFTLKNYSSYSGTEAIHLGNTNLIKASLATLNSFLGDEDQALHVFFHSNYHASEPEVATHIQHWRLIYELTGKGLHIQGEGGEIALDEADFIVYNDPSSDNIWVRSTKQIICDALEPSIDALQVGGKITSSIVLVKNYFN